MKAGGGWWTYHFDNETSIIVGHDSIYSHPNITCEMLRLVAALIVYGRFTSKSLNSLLFYPKCVDRVIFLPSASLTSMRKKGMCTKKWCKSYNSRKGTYVSHFYQTRLSILDVAYYVMSYLVVTLCY